MYKYLIFCIAILSVGCTNQSEKNTRYTTEQIASLQLGSTKLLKVEADSATRIDLNPFLKKQHFDFGPLVKEIKLIPLETTKKSLIDDIRKVIITGSYVYIHDDFQSGGIVVFDNKGKFIKRIPNGKGPGELLRLYDIDFDKENNELIAYQHSFLLHFTPSGKFIRQERLPFGFYNFTIIPGGYVFKTIEGAQCNQHFGKLKNYTLLVTDKKFKLKSVGIHKLPGQIDFTWRHLLQNNGSLSITHGFTDTIFQYDYATENLKVQYILDYSKKKLPNSCLNGGWERFESTIKSTDYFFFLGQYNHTSSHDVFFLDNWFENVCLVVFRDKNSGKLIGGTTAHFDSNEMPSLAFSELVSGDYFISPYYIKGNEPFVSKSAIITDQDKQKLKGLTKNDNPVLVLFKLKNF